MTRSIRSALLLPFVFAGPAWADISADEYWALQQKIVASYGLTLTGEVERNGNVVTLSGISTQAILPNDFGEFSLRLDQISLTENTDGTLSIGVPDTTSVNFFGIFGPDDNVTITGQLAMTYAGMENVISGSIDNLIADYSYDTLSVTLNELDVSGDIDALPVDIVYQMVANDYSARRSTMTDDLLHHTHDSTVGNIQYTYRFEMPDGTFQSQSTSISDIVSNVHLTQPLTPMDWMNFAAALRDGFAFQSDSTMASTTTRSASRSAETGTMKQEQSIEQINQILSLDMSGLQFSGDVQSISANLNMPTLLPAPIEFSAGATSGAFALPLMADPSTQTLRYQLSLPAFSVSDNVWDMFDIEGQLQRDPMGVEVDFAADIVLKQDLLDIAAMQDLANTAQSPLDFADVEQVRLNSFAVNAAGAAVEASGAFALDLTDLDSFDGLPRPEGSGRVTYSGINQLLDTLIAMDLITAQDAMGARMGLAMFSQATGDDMMETAVEVTPDGQVLVNGQRMR